MLLFLTPQRNEKLSPKSLICSLLEEGLNKQVLMVPWVIFVTFREGHASCFPIYSLYADLR